MGYKKHTVFLTRLLISTLVAVSLVILGQGCATSPKTKELGADGTGGKIRAQALRDNVVSITVKWQDKYGIQKMQPGFGFIVGERDRQAYIVTAYHVAQPKYLKEVPDTPVIISVKYFSWPDTTYSASFVRGDSQNDLAVLKAEFPEGLRWFRNILSPESPKSRTRVWFIGRTGEDDHWYIPSVPGSVNEFDRKREIKIDKLDVLPGSSGAPLIDESGIVGMIVTDSDITTKALPIGFIKTTTLKWRFPWELTEPPVNNGRRPWYKKWWVRAGAVVVVALVGALIFGGGGGGGGEEDTTLSVGAPFPEP